VGDFLVGSSHLHHLATLHGREQTTLLERRMEQDKRAYLKNDVFATPGSAAVWWLVNHPGEVEAALGLLDTLAELSAAANDLPVRHLAAARQSDPPRTRLRQRCRPPPRRTRRGSTI
jgi:hypothetical protein